MGKFPFMDEGIRKRFAQVVDVLGIDMKAASRSLEPEQKLGETYVRDVVKRGRGKQEIVLAIMKVVRPDFHDFVAFNVGRGPRPNDREAFVRSQIASTQRRVRVVGLTGAGGEIGIEGLGPDEAINADVPDGTVAVRIKGDSLGPGFDGWYALYSERQIGFTDDLFGQLCIVQTEDSRTLIKWVRRAPAAGVNLVSGTGAIEEGVLLVWAARVMEIRHPYS